MNYGTGDIENPSFTFSATKEVGAGLLFGEIDATSAYMAGDITIDGSLQDALSYQDINQIGIEAFENLVEDL